MKTGHALASAWKSNKSLWETENDNKDYIPLEIYLRRAYEGYRQMMLYFPDEPLSFAKWLLSEFEPKNIEP